MGIFRKVGDWLTEKSERFVRGDAPAYAGYYGTQEAERSYAGMSSQKPEGEAESVEQEQGGVDPFGEYGGRVPYRSRYDIEREAYEAAQQAAKASSTQNFRPVRQAPELQPQDASTARAQGMQPPMQQAPIQQPPMQQAPAQGRPAQPYQYAAQGYQQPPQNVVPFPGIQRAADGAYFAHVEYVVSIHSRSECQNVIGYMKANASVFLNMEFIASDGDRQRCVDLLSGAAYTLGCRLNKISARGIYLISSPSVQVILDSATQRLAASSEAQGFARQRYDTEGYGAYAAQRQETAQAAPVSGFSSGSPTTRFQTQGAQRDPSASFGSVMAGGASPNAYTQGAQTASYAAQRYPAQGQ